MTNFLTSPRNLVIFAALMVSVSSAFSQASSAAEDRRDPTGEDCLLMTDHAVSSLRSYFDLDKTKIELSATEVCSQLERAPSKISLEEALRSALLSFGNDHAHIESPFAIALTLASEEQGVPDRSPYPSETLDRAHMILREHLNKSEAKIVLLPMDQEPEHGESVRTNWIIRLKMPTLSDHIFWAIVDRDGVRPTYNYGFN